MNPNRSSWPVVAVLAAWCALASVACAAPKNADEDAIRAQTRAWEKAYNGGDPQGVAAPYADDALLLPPGAPGVRGRAAIRAFFEKDIGDAKAAGVTFAIVYPTEVGVAGNMGWESGTYKALVKGAVVEAGKFLSVSRKQDGKWLYIRDTWNADAAPAPPPAATPAAPRK
jgi:uncharacterized protein (TIGR02246 family)